MTKSHPLKAIKVMAGSFSWCLLFTFIGFEVFLDYCPSKDLQILGPNQLKDRPPVLSKLANYDEEHAQGTPIALLGSSLAQYASNLCDYHQYGSPDLNSQFGSYSRFRYLDQVVFKATGNRLQVETANLANPGTMISEEYFILKEVMSKKNPPRAIVLEIGPRDFIDNMTPEPYRSRLSQVLSKRQEPFSWRVDRSLSENIDITAEKTSLFYSMRGELHDCLLRIACDYLHRPASIYQASLLAKLAPAASVASKKEEAKSNSNQASKLSANKNQGQIGHIDDCVGSPALKAYSLSEYKNRYLPINRKKWQEEVFNLAKLVAFCRSKNVPLVVVNMPLTPVNLQILPEDFRVEYERTIRDICKPAHGVSNLVYVDLRQDGRFVENDFRDTVHMRSSGGKKLVDLLGPIVASRLAGSDTNVGNARFATRPGSVQ